jgi:hypothetical protein
MLAGRVKEKVGEWGRKMLLKRMVCGIVAGLEMGL